MRTDKICTEALRRRTAGRRRGWAAVVGPLALLAMVAGSPALRAEVFGRGVAVQTDVAYGPEPLETMDICSASSGRPAPALVFIHGGNWQHGDKAGLKGMCRAAAEKGMVGVTVDYSLATDTSNHWPKQATDVERALAWLRDHAGDVGVDPSRICLFGSSAGAQIALFIATARSEKPGLSCLILNATPADLTDPAIRVPSRALFGTDGRSRQLEADASPLFRVGQTTPPTLLIHGRNDPLVPFQQADALATKLRANGVAVQTLYHEGEHGTGKLPLDERRDINKAVIDFASRHLIGSN